MEIDENEERHNNNCSEREREKERERKISAHYFQFNFNLQYYLLNYPFHPSHPIYSIMNPQRIIELQKHYQNTLNHYG